MTRHEDLGLGADAATGDLLQGLALLGVGPAPVPSPALRKFLEEQQVLAIPLQRQAAASEPDPAEPRGRGAHRQSRAASTGRTWRPGRLPVRFASLGLAMKVVLGGGVALAGVTGAGVAGALPPALQDAWDGAFTSAPPTHAPAADEPAQQDPASEQPAAGARSAPGPAAGPEAPGGGRLPAPTDPEDASGSGDEWGPPAPAAGAAPVGQQPGPAAGYVPPPTGEATEQDGAPVPIAPVAPQPVFNEGPTTDSNMPVGETWAPAPVRPTAEPTYPSSAPPSPTGESTWQPTTDQPSTAPLPTSSDPAAGGSSNGGDYRNR